MAIAETRRAQGRRPASGSRREEGVALLRDARPAGAGHARRRRAPAPAPRGRSSPTSSTATSTTRTSAPRSARSARSTATCPRRRATCSRKAAARAEDRGDDRARRPPDPAAGRPAPGPRHRVLRGAVPLDEGELPDLDPRPLAGRGEAHLQGLERSTTEETLRRLIAAGLDSIPGGGAEVLSDRVRKIIGIAKGSTADWLEVMEVAHGLGLQDDGHHDVRPRGDARGAHRPPAAPARAAGPHAAASPPSSPGPSSPRTRRWRATS